MFEVKSVEQGSVCERYGIQKGDVIISVNGEELIDYIDYIYFCAEKKLKIKLSGKNGSRTVKIYKGEQEDLGLEFTKPLLGKKRVCSNKCIFCFVDQLPKGMRKSLYFKDEDWRYSFIMGNYITLASISKNEFRRILKRGVSPLYISVHTVDEKLRKDMLRNKNAISVRRVLKKLAAKGISFHAQVVVCPGYNDKEKLEQTYKFLRNLYPAATSLAVVPVGLTAFRSGLEQITPVDKSMARHTVKEVEKWQKECFNSIGTRFVFAADEYYIKAGLSLPLAKEYESFDQIENGVGLMAKFSDEAKRVLEKCEYNKKHISIATGQDAYPFFIELSALAEKKCGAKIDVYMVKNHTFGGGVTVSGLLGGKDYAKALKGKDLGRALLISGGSLRDDKIFLDDMTLGQLKKELGIPVYPVSDGYHFAKLISKI